jgi:hypothetical protein
LPAIGVTTTVALASTLVASEDSFYTRVFIPRRAGIRQISPFAEPESFGWSERCGEWEVLAGSKPTNFFTSQLHQERLARKLGERLAILITWTGRRKAAKRAFFRHFRGLWPFGAIVGYSFEFQTLPA